MADVFAAIGTTKVGPSINLQGSFTPFLGFKGVDGRRLKTPWGAGDWVVERTTPEGSLSSLQAGSSPFTGMGDGGLVINQGDVFGGNITQGDMTVTEGDMYSESNYYNIEGAIGPIGPPGADGSSGAPGDRGEAGTAGIAGEIGPRGFMGLPGEAGIQGEAGPKGDPGDDGEDGEQGIRGPAGADGATGATGAAGAAGAVNMLPFAVTGNDTGDGVYTCRLQIIDATNWGDTAGAVRFINDPADETTYYVLNLKEFHVNGTYARQLATGDILFAWTDTDDGDNERWIGYPVGPYSGQVYRAQVQEDAPADANISVKLTDQDGTEIGSAFDVACEICGGSALNAAVPRLDTSDNDIIFVTNIGGTWYCTTTFQTTEDCDCYTI